MAAPNKTEELTREVRDYIRQAFITRDGRDLTVSGVARALGTTRTTLQNKGLNRLIRRAAARAASRARTNRATDELEASVVVLADEVRTWRQRYQAMLQRWLIVEAALKDHPDVDLDRILQIGLPKPDRSVPAPSRGAKSRRRDLYERRS